MSHQQKAEGRARKRITANSAFETQLPTNLIRSLALAPLPGDCRADLKPRYCPPADAGRVFEDGSAGVLIKSAQISRPRPWRNRNGVSLLKLLAATGSC
jgi:hypothetical protein